VLYLIDFQLLSNFVATSYNFTWRYLPVLGSIASMACVEAAARINTSELIRSQFSVVETGELQGWTIGQQGFPISDFIQFAHPDNCVSGAEWRPFNRPEVAVLFKRNMVMSQVPERNSRPTQSGVTKSCLSDVALPKSESSRKVLLEVLSKGMGDKVIWKRRYRCPGGGADKPGATGANCAKVGGGTWCTANGPCDLGCGWLANPSKRQRDHNKLDHACDATITVVITVKSALESKRLIHFNVGAHKFDGWTGPQKKKRRMADSTLAVVERMAGKPHASLDTYDAAIRSPGAADDTRSASLKTIKRKMQRERRATRGDIFGDWTSALTCLKNVVVPRNTARAERGLGTMLFFNSNAENMQVVASTEQQLKRFLLHGEKVAQTDAKNDFGPGISISSVGIFQPPRRRLGPAVLSLQTTESAQSIAIMLKSLQHNTPCSRDCKHEIIEQRNYQGSFLRWRTCRGRPEYNEGVGGLIMSEDPLAFSQLSYCYSSSSSFSSPPPPLPPSPILPFATTLLHLPTLPIVPPPPLPPLPPPLPPTSVALPTPLLHIDQCTKAKSAAASAGMKITVCDFHLFASQDEHLKDVFGLTPGEVTVMNLASHICNRSLTDDRHVAVVNEVTKQIDVWYAAGHFQELAPKSKTVAELKTYFHNHNGGGGGANNAPASQWQGAVGDHSGIDHSGSLIPGFSTTTSAVESWHKSVDVNLLGGYRNNNVCIPMLQWLFGLNADGSDTSHPSRSLWELNDLLLEQDSALSPDRATTTVRRMNGSWLFLNNHVLIGTGSNDGYAFVRLGEHAIAVDSEEEEAKRRARNAAAAGDVDGAGAMSLLPVIKMLFGPDIPVRKGYATVNELLCNTCGDYRWRGPSICGCKHMCAYLAGKGSYGSKDDMQGYLSRKSSDRERNKPPMAKVADLYTRDWKVQSRCYSQGGVSRSSASAAASSSSGGDNGSSSSADNSNGPTRVVVPCGLDLHNLAHFEETGDGSLRVSALKLPESEVTLRLGFRLSSGQVLSASQRVAAPKAQLLLSSAAAAPHTRPWYLSARPGSSNQAPAHRDISSLQRNGERPQAREPGNGRAHCRVETTVKAVDALAPTSVKAKPQKGRKGISGKIKSRKKKKQSPAVAAAAVAAVRGIKDSSSGGDGKGGDTKKRKGRE
jgi:hypothetical protein